MDDRPPHGSSGHPQQQGAVASSHAAPWPQQQPQQYGAPIAGHAPHHAPIQPQGGPTMQQFQYAADGFVMPGAATAQQPQMSAHGGTIGMPQPQMHQGHGQAMPLVNGTAAAFDPVLQQAQTWAFPTPHGMQLVQAGAPAHVPMQHQLPGLAPHAQHQQQYQQQPLAMVQGAGVSAAPSMGRRTRWETIVPAVAVACLCAAIWLFISDFDRITGRDMARDAASKQAADMDAKPAAGSAGEAAEIVEEATTLFEQGRFDDAANLLHPILDGASPDAAAVALHDKVDAAGARNKALLMRLSAQRRGKQWSGVVATVGLLEQLRPLSADLVTLRTQARKAMVFATAHARATGFAREGRTTKALATIAAALKSGRNAKLEALRAQIQGQRPDATGGGGGATSQRRTTMPPKAGGAPSGSGSAKKLPPKGNAGPAVIPPRPGTNPVTNPGTGAGAVGGGPESSCHTHEGVQSCH